jgi:hypothetical protein
MIYLTTVSLSENIESRGKFGRSQWPRRLRHVGRGVVGSNPIQGMDVCIVCVYSVFVLFCVQVAALRLADLPSKEAYRLCTRLRNWKSRQGPTKYCRAIER